MEQIECELRSFIDKQKYLELLEKFRKEAEVIAEDDQITYYFDLPQDLRIQQNNSYSKIWLKGGKMHDEAREEIEIRCAKDDFGNLERLFAAIGIKPNIKWFRKRNEFAWQGIRVCVDYTRGYGYIVELEQVVGPDESDAAVRSLKKKLQSLGVDETSKEIFDRKLEYYKQHWCSLIETE